MDLKLNRLTRSFDLATIGMLFVDDEPKFLTLEDPDKDNQQGVSCISEGAYQCKKTVNRRLKSGKLIPLTLEVLDVPHRSGILFHGGNTQDDTRGCILLGMGLSLNNSRAITNSTSAMMVFREILQRVVEPINLYIFWS